MKIMVAEYAVATGDPEIIAEGCAMLRSLVNSFDASGHQVRYPARRQVTGIRGEAVKCTDFERSVEEVARMCDAGIVIAPDEILADLTRVVEESTVNLGCPSESVRKCADKLVCSQILSDNGIAVPKMADDAGMYVIKPRWGCASEGISVVTEKVEPGDGFIVTEFVSGEHLSASLIIGDTTLPLTVNKQTIETGIGYNGGIVPYQTPRWDEVMDVAAAAARVLGCRGYVGLDIVAGDRLYVVDVNPRPTTSILGIVRVIDHEIGDLLIRARFGELPDAIGINGSFSFTKSDLDVILDAKEVEPADYR
ncbi:MAG TPA: ATP-grasp domain-containing protein [Methanosarcinales archaeon]|nr:ATP-grasp domain-containing protein [Methanosarcinales archaeon]